MSTTTKTEIEKNERLYIYRIWYQFNDQIAPLVHADLSAFQRSLVADLDTDCRAEVFFKDDGKGQDGYSEFWVRFPARYATLGQVYLSIVRTLRGIVEKQDPQAWAFADKDNGFAELDYNAVHSIWS